MNVLSNMVGAVRPGGSILDLQVIRPNPRVELGGELICEIDGEPLFEKADAAVEAVEAMILTGGLVQDAVDDHDVREHYPNGIDLVDEFKDRLRRIPEESVPRLLVIEEPLTIRERCRLRRLTVDQR